MICTIIDQNRKNLQILGFCHAFRQKKPALPANFFHFPIDKALTEGYNNYFIKIECRKYTTERKLSGQE